jgi:hypothetical protein
MGFMALAVVLYAKTRALLPKTDMGPYTFNHAGVSTLYLAIQ